MVFTGLAEGTPTPTTSWYKNAVIINPAGTDRLTITANGSLSVAKINEGDGGVYQCFRQNAFGEESVSTWLRIKRKEGHLWPRNAFSNNNVLTAQPRTGLIAD